jgi:hypothetical protein
MDRKDQSEDTFEFSGSIFLITSDGKILNLPIPSESEYDPLNWSSRRRYLALFSIGFFSFVGLVAVLGPNLAVYGLEQDFSFEVSYGVVTSTLILHSTL